MKPANPALVEWAQQIAAEHREQRVNEVTTRIISHMEAFTQATLGLEFYADKQPYEMDAASSQACAALEVAKSQAEQAVLAIVKSLMG